MNKLLAGCIIGLVLGIAISAAASTAWSTYSQQEKAIFVSGVKAGLIFANNLLAQGVKPEGIQVFAKYVSMCAQSEQMVDVVQAIDNKDISYDQQIPGTVAMELAKCGGFVP